MASKVASSSIWLVIVLVLTTMTITSHSVEMVSCNQAVMLLAPCTAYLTEQENEPSSTCCQSIATMNNIADESPTNRKNVCMCLKQAAVAGGVIPEKAAGLPKLCHVHVEGSINFNVDCNRISFDNVQNEIDGRKNMGTETKTENTSELDHRVPPSPTHIDAEVGINHHKNLETKAYNPTRPSNSLGRPSPYAVQSLGVPPPIDVQKFAVPPPYEYRDMQFGIDQQKSMESTEGRPIPSVSQELDHRVPPSPTQIDTEVGSNHHKDMEMKAYRPTTTGVSPGIGHNASPP